MYYGNRYNSIREASRELKISKSHFQRLLRDPSKPEIYVLKDEVQEYGKIPIFAKSQNGPSVLFQSISACVEAGYASSIQNARRKIKRGEPGWRYAALDSCGKPVCTPYVLKPGEISYEMLCLPLPVPLPFVTFFTSGEEGGFGKAERHGQAEPNKQN